MINNKILSTYLELKDFDDELALDLNQSIKFHWANWQETCDFKIRNGDTTDIERSISLYKSIPIWLLLQNKKIQSNLLELYQHYLNDNKSPTKSSFHLSIGKEQGPYISYNSMAWLNNNILRNIVFSKIYKSELKKRQFRLGWESSPLLKLDSFFHSGVDIRTHAITDHGIIFKILGKSNFERVLNSKQIVLNINLNPFLRSVREFQDDFLQAIAKEDFSHHDIKNLHSFSIKPKNMVTNLKEVQAQDAQSFHFFVAFDHLESDQSNFSLKTPIQRFLLNTKECFELQLIA